MFFDAVRSAALILLTVLVGATLASTISVTPARADGGQGKPFGITSFSMQTTEAVPTPYGPGLPGYGFANKPYVFTQADGHPYALTSSIEFAAEEIGENHSVVPTQDPKDMIIDLPSGLSTNPLAVARCPHTQAVTDGTCPVDSQVGVFVLHYSGGKAMLGPIVDLTPETGQTAELGLVTPFKIIFPLTGRIVRAPGGYGLSLHATGLPQLRITDVETTLWGIPAEAVHDPLRGLACIGKVEQQWTCEGGGAKSGEAALAFLTMPSDCSTGPQTGGVWADSWNEPGLYLQAQSPFPAVTGCEQLLFAPSIEVSPDTLLADEPVGVDVSIATPPSENEQAVASPPLRTVRLTLAQGVSISPGVADGVQACGRSGPEGIDIPTGLNAKGEPLEPSETGEGEEPGPNGEPQLAPGHCPQASTVGSAEALTPLLANPIKGRVYLASPGCGGPTQAPCTQADVLDGNLYRLYVELGGEPGDEGVDIKLEAKVQANPATGQLTLTLAESPQLPLGRLSIALNGGPRALLDNPATCGDATTTSDLQAWSAPGRTPAPESLLVSGTPDAAPSSFYEVSGCAASTGFHPGFVAGTLAPQAGAFSAFTFTVTRDDREPYLSQIQLHAPAGLSAMLSSVPRCEEAPANAGQCSQTSLIGSALFASGAGSHPFEMPGRVYLTVGYDGAPFGLSIVTDAAAGPLNLGMAVIRARIDINPQTAAIEITSDPLPQIVLGVPLRLQKVALDIDRPGFMFNPTNCNPLLITTTVAGTQGTSAEASNPFAAADCKGLDFKPKFTASASGTSYTKGASLDLKLAFPNTQQGTEANLAQIKVALPRQLPSRLTTLQNACPETIFGTDPAACPTTSVVGIARARIPVLDSKLTGPVYFVSHGRNAFPSPVVVLQGDGVSIVLLGSTTIEKSGLARIEFDALPDIPIDSLELYLPQGPHSVLGANTSLCTLTRTVASKRDVLEHLHGYSKRRVIEVHERIRASLLMPTELVAQNGAVVHQSTKIEVNGCPARKAKAATNTLPRKT